MDWIEVLAAYAELEPSAMRHPDETCRGIPDALMHAKQLAADGYLYRSPATGYFRITDAGKEMHKALNS